MSSLESVLSTLDPIVRDLIAPEAPALDRDAAFPSRAITALGEAGLLGLNIPTAHGGVGLGLTATAHIVERVAQSCASTAMVLCMHYCGAAVLAAHGPAEVQRAVAAGRHLSTLAFSEAGSRSHFWAPLGTARAEGDQIVLDASKSWITSARHATAYIWSSRPVGGVGMSTLWLVPGDTGGLSAPTPFDGLGLRGNDSRPVQAAGVRVPKGAMLGKDGGGFDGMMGLVLPAFNVMSASVSIGLCEAAVSATTAHAGATRHHETSTSLAELPTIRAHIARMRIRTDMARTLWLDTLGALSAGRSDAMLRVLQVKAAAAESALEVTATAMRVCGGAAYRREVGVERAFRDAQAASIMGPTTDVLWDFIGKAACGLSLF